MIREVGMLQCIYKVRQENTIADYVTKEPP